MIKKFVLILMFFYVHCAAQSDSILIHINNAVENLIEESGEETDDSDFYELIEYYLEHPLDINTATEKELAELPYFDPSAARTIVEHRIKYGTFFSTQELYSLKGLPEDLVSKIIPFLTISKSSKAEQVKEPKIKPGIFSLKLRQRLINDLKDRKGFIDHNYTGSQIKLYNKLSINYDQKLRAGLVTEKDPGERSYHDYTSGFISLTDYYGFRNIIIGDYSINFGQGLALWKSYGISKSSDAIFSVKKPADIIKPSSGTNENNFFRGAAVSYNWEHIGATGFYSKHKQDARLDSATNKIMSLRTDGFHRTANEIKTRNTIMEEAGGIELNYTSSKINTGLLYYNSHFDHTFFSSKPYELKGNNFNYITNYIDLFILNFNIFSELSITVKSSPAFLAGLCYSISSDFCYSLLIRNYPANFLSLHGSTFGERSGAHYAQFGIYNGFRWRTSLGTLNFYYDQLKYPFANTMNPLPTEGSEYMIHYHGKPWKNCEAGIMVRVNNKETALLINEEESMIRRLKQSIRIEYTHTVTKQLRLKTRIEYLSVFARAQRIREEGYLFYEDIRYMPADGLFVYGRIIFFETDSFNSAVYEYENDLTGILSSVGLYGEGMRFYIAARYNIFNEVSVSVKYSETFKPGVNSLGAGNQEISGNIENKIGLQIDITL